MCTWYVSHAGLLFVLNNLLGSSGASLLRTFVWQLVVSGLVRVFFEFPYIFGQFVSNLGKNLVELLLWVCFFFGRLSVNIRRHGGWRGCSGELVFCS